MKILETKRLILREMSVDDYPALASILQDSQVMIAYEHAFSDKEVQTWLNNQLRRYHEDGFGLWAVILKANHEMIGQCGITLQMINNSPVHEVGYLFNQNYWHQGYATEAAKACLDYGFTQLKLNKIYSIIRDTNLASQKVALRNHLKYETTLIKHYYNMDMPHFVYSLCLNEYKKTGSQIMGSL